MTTHTAINEIRFETQLSTQQQPYLQDYCIQGSVVFPLAGYLEMILAALADSYRLGRHTLTKIKVREALTLPETGVRTVQIVLSSQQEACSQINFQIISQPLDTEQDSEQWTLHVSGHNYYSLLSSINTEPAAVSLADIRTRCSEQISPARFYQELQTRGMMDDLTFQGIQKVYRRDGEALGQIQLFQSLASEAAYYHIHPTLLEASIQILFASLPVDSFPIINKATYQPISLESFCFYRHPSNQVWSHAFLKLEKEDNPDTFEGDVRLFNETGQLIAEILGLRYQRLESALTKATVLTVVPEKRLQLLEAYIHKQVARVLKLPTSKLSVHLPLSRYGLDSLMAIELQNKFNADLQIAVPLVKLIQGNTIAQLAAETLFLINLSNTQFTANIPNEKVKK